jgi:pyruvate dehydrogenase E1 component alpha subunit
MERSPWEPEGVECLLDAHGEPTGPQAIEALAAMDLPTIWQACKRARTLDAALVDLDLPGFVSGAGEEAPLIATALLAGSDDWIYPSRRDLALSCTRGIPVEDLLAHLMGKASESSDTSSRGFNLAPPPGSNERGIAAQSRHLGFHLPLAAGQAHAQKLANLGHATIAIFGEGSTTLGSFHETLALAARADLPLIFLCKSQIWPDGAPAEAGLLGDSVAERTRACGLWTRRIDGADAAGVWHGVQKAFDRAREGAGPSVLDVVVTRLGSGGSSVPKHRDPLDRLGIYLKKSGHDLLALESSANMQDKSKLIQALRALGYSRGAEHEHENPAPSTQEKIKDAARASA